LESYPWDETVAAAGEVGGGPATDGQPVDAVELEDDLVGATIRDGGISAVAAPSPALRSRCVPYLKRARPG
jgi:hypothetical protein